MYVYQQTEPGLWTVGFFHPATNEWMTESDHNSTDKAANRVAWLNGSKKEGG